MSRIPKHSGRDMVKVLKVFGFKAGRQKGSHVPMTKDGSPRPVVVPMYSDLPDFIVSNNLRAADIDRKDYIYVLKKGRLPG